MRLWFVLPVRVPPPNDGKVVVEGQWLVVGGKSAVHSYLRYILTAGVFNFDGGGDCRHFFYFRFMMFERFHLMFERFSRHSFFKPSNSHLFHICWYSSTTSAPPSFIPLISIVRQCLHIAHMFHHSTIIHFTIYRLLSLPFIVSYR